MVRRRGEIKLLMDPGIVTETKDDTAAPGPEETGGERRCIVTRVTAEKSRMIRFVLDAEGVVTPDLKARLPGRGYWVLAEAGALGKAIERNAFARAARRKALVPVDLGERVRALAEQEVIELIGLARRSGDLVAGFEKVQAALRHGGVRLLLEASDAARDGREKLARLAHPGVEICAPLPAARLAGAIGRDHAVHVAVRETGLAERLAAAIKRLSGIRAAETERTRH